MKKYTAIGVVRLHAGVIQLTDEQAKSRIHLLIVKSEKRGTYEIKPNATLTLKAGEEFGYDGVVPKSMANLLADPKTGETVTDSNLKAKGKPARSETKTADENPMSDERLLELLNAIDLLEPGNEAHWTVAGSPEVAALKEITGGKVSGKERDEAWAEYQAEKESPEGTAEDGNENIDSESPQE